MLLHFRDLHPCPTLDDPARPHVQRAYQEGKIALCGFMHFANHYTSDPEEVSCRACRASIDLLRRYGVELPVPEPQD